MRWTGAATAAAALMTGFGARAAPVTTTGSFGVSAVVLKSCSIVAAPLAFGNYDPTSSTPTDANTTLVVLCTSGTSYQVGLNAGTGAGATVGARKMTSGTDTLNYALFQDSNRSINWGNTPGTDTPTAATAGILPATLTVYGRTAAGQNVPSGTYNDTVTVTVTY